MKDAKITFTSMREVVSKLFDTSGIPIRLEDVEIWKIWDEAVGTNVANHARPSSIKKGLLVVKVTDSVWLQELEYQEEIIRKRLNENLRRWAVKKIKFRVGAPRNESEVKKRAIAEKCNNDLSKSPVCKPCQMK